MTAMPPLHSNGKADITELPDPPRQQLTWHQYIAIVHERCRTQMQQPFLDDRPMTDDNPPGCSLMDFKQPRLRRCPFGIEALQFTDRITEKPDPRRDKFDDGLDGYNWKIKFDRVPDQLFVLKLFWDPEPQDPPMYFAPQRECQNVALLQQMQVALSAEQSWRGPILIFPQPAGNEEVKFNMRAFSNKRRKPLSLIAQEIRDEVVEVPVMPHVRQCYGWLKISSDELRHKLPGSLRPLFIQTDKVKRQLQPNVTCTALVYEYVDEADNDAECVQQAVDFFWQVGFGHTTSLKANNWKDSVIVDYSDIVYPSAIGWRDKTFGHTYAADILRIY